MGMGLREFNSFLPAVFNEVSLSGGTFCLFPMVWYIIDKCQELQVPAVVSFINFDKAFDSLHWPSLWKILNSYGFPVKVVRVIEWIYKILTVVYRWMMATATGLRCSLVTVKVGFSLQFSLPLQLTGSWRKQQRYWVEYWQKIVTPRFCW